ncbi:D-glycero-beta-D-manno-heptose 1-phosphate adenylyltransferase [Flexithrix dorotheae]|uniref:D-glycero-beta-D-manno-heptose 1-phosphate adenylyltransferase n=1 Tax=Flexithrix dorotheae TaxID=70993 RepID=UPI000371BC70|nr:D-glycero-beta-D-manno-heptose 1-phosphate adenylyltransferase [Flexithrix dorotheae]
MKSNTKAKIFEIDDLLKVREGWKQTEEKVVFSNGCFDILHLGHVDYLEKAANLGDRLIIGLNTDSSVSKLKGPERPINDEYARARLLAALEFVDAVILFGEDTPLKLINTLLPDILVKGNDYAVENIVGADVVLKNGGELKTISLVEGFSTTKIISKIQTNR